MRTDLSGRDPDAAITALARETADKIATRIEWLARNHNAITTTLVDREKAMRDAATESITAALCAVRDETREECAREVETVSVLTPTMRQSIAKALRAGVGGAG